MSEDIAEIAAKLTNAQRYMLIRPNGRYSDALSDVGAILDLELWGTGLTPLGQKVRAHLLARENGGAK